MDSRYRQSPNSGGARDAVSEDPAHSAVVAITGGARGIGKATADLFTTKGARVCVGDLDGAENALDVTSAASFASFRDATLKRFGRIDILVNNADVMPLGDFLSEDAATSRRRST
jgi:NAD(P)-dependent dehydrogenase (short-subunit alcohol dehydrogenase family)